MKLNIAENSDHMAYSFWKVTQLSRNAERYPHQYLYTQSLGFDSTRVTVGILIEWARVDAYVSHDNIWHFCSLSLKMHKIYIGNSAFWHFMNSVIKPVVFSWCVSDWENLPFSEIPMHSTSSTVLDSSAIYFSIAAASDSGECRTLISMLSCSMDNINRYSMFRGM